VLDGAEVAGGVGSPILEGCCGGGRGDNVLKTLPAAKQRKTLLPTAQTQYVAWLGICKMLTLECPKF